MSRGNDAIIQAQLIEKKARYFYKNNLPVHINLKKKDYEEEPTWENGWIEEEPSADFFILRLREEGKKKYNGAETVAMFFLQIEDIEEFHEANDGE